MSVQAATAHLAVPPHSACAGGSVPSSPSHEPGSQLLTSNRTVEDLTDELLAGCNKTSSKAAAETWSRARRAHEELHAMLADAGMKLPEHQPQAPFAPGPPGSVASAHCERACGARMTAQTASATAAFFPGEWWRALSTDVLAALVVDSFASNFSSAFVDGLVDHLQEKEGWHVPQQVPARPHGTVSGLASRLGRSASVPGSIGDLQRPLSISLPQRPYEALAAASLGRTAPRQRAVPAGAIGVAGRDPRQGWSVQRHHPCRPTGLYPRVGASEAGCATKRWPSTGAGAQPEEVVDHRKYVWPMMATNFPDAWEEKTSKKQQRHSTHEKEKDAKNEPNERWHLKVDDEGRTIFPYSLALHKAFLESQSDPKTRETAMAVAPVRLTRSLHS